MHYNIPIAGYPGITKTLKLIRQRYDALALRKSVEDYISQYLLCQKNKSARHAKYSEIKFATVLTTLQDNITIDFIVKLPKLKDPTTDISYNSIIVVVDRLTKYSILILFKESYTALQIAYILLDRVVREYRIPKIITLDRDKLFILNFQKTLVATLRVKLRMSTAYYLQTDSQTKRIN